MNVEAERRALLVLAIVLLIAIALGSALVAGMLWRLSIAASGLAGGCALAAALRLVRLIDETTRPRR